MPLYDDELDPPSYKPLHYMEIEVYENNVVHGWFDEARTFGDDIALCHSELSEALDYYSEIGMETRTREDGKPIDVASEFAEVFIRLLDTCKRYNIDLESEYERKMEYNRARPYKHGNKAL